MTEADLRRQRIKEDIGTTDIVEDAGFLLPDGAMISMVDKPRGEWERGHNLLIDYYDDLKGEQDRLYELDMQGQWKDEYYDVQNELYDEAVSRFLQEGNIRLVPDGPGIAICSNHKITREQKMALYDIVDYAKNDASRWTDKFYIDVQGPISTYGFNYDIATLSVARIMRDLEPEKNKDLNQEK